jgi:hypothetical protein
VSIAPFNTSMSPPSASTFSTSTTRSPRRAQNRSMVVTGITNSPARGASAAAVPLVALVLLLVVVGGGTKVSRPLSSFFLEKKPIVVSLGTVAVSAALRYSNVGRTNDAGYGAVTWAAWWCCVSFGRRCGKRW